MSKTAIVILAAGSSSRLGKPKQLLPYQQKTLIEFITNEAVQTGWPVIVVIGAAAGEVSALLENKAVDLVYNPHWQSGLASGIVAGVSKAASANKQLQAIILAVCDQPFVTTELFRQLQSTHLETKKEIVACGYAGTAGTPVLFAKKYFEALQNLSGTEGAKKLVKLHGKDVAIVPFPEGAVDIDTEEDYQRLLRSRF